MASLHLDTLRAGLCAHASIARRHFQAVARHRLLRFCGSGRLCGVAASRLQVGLQRTTCGRAQIDGFGTAFDQIVEKHLRAHLQAVLPVELGEGQGGVGGMVAEGTFKKGQMNTFRVTDSETEIEIRFEGILPDLITEGQGAVADGRVVNGVFIADEVLAKHDEKYMPAEIEDLHEKMPGNANSS